MIGNTQSQAEKDQGTPGPKRFRKKEGKKTKRGE